MMKLFLSLLLATPSLAWVSVRASRSATAISLTSDEIVANARAKIGLPPEDDDEYPQIFEEHLMNDMRSALLKLEQRVQEGPGGLSILQVEELDGELRRILAEMKANQDQRPVKGASAPVTRVATTTAITDTSMDEGPVYDGTGGMGQPRGTVNTYALDGMEEMSPAEYQKKLQESIIERQRQRRHNSNITTGNKATWNYLSSL